jgi:pimeloyl-ACP methyl ester carboxylesterase
MAALTKEHCVIALDLPGHGSSSKPDDPSAYGLQMVADAILLMDHLQIKKAHIVGYSLGGMIALKLLAMHPDRAYSGTLGGMGWLRDGSMLQRVWEPMSRRNDAPNGGRRGGTPSACVASIGELALTKAELMAIRVPTRILIGSRDPVKSLYVLPLENVRPDWSVVDIPNAGHINCVYQPAFISGVVDWINRNRQR